MAVVVGTAAAAATGVVGTVAATAGATAVADMATAPETPEETAVTATGGGAAVATGAHVEARNVGVVSLFRWCSVVWVHTGWCSCVFFFNSERVSL